MKRRFVLCCVAVLIAVVVSSSTLGAADRGARLHRRITVEWLRGTCNACSSHQIDRFQFVDDRGAWALSESVSEKGNGAGSSTVLHTTDGGRSWKQAPFLDKDGEKLPSVFWFTDSKHGWLSWVDDGAVDHLQKTDDGGLTWTILPSQGALSTIQFFNRHEGILVASIAFRQDEFGVTQDGGKSWTKTQLDIQHTVATCFLNRDIGWVIGTAAGSEAEGQLGVLRTVDGGKNWAWGPLTGFQFATVQDVARVNDGTGWVLLWMGGDEGSRLLETRDGGVSWNTHHDESVQGKGKYLTAIKFVNNSVGYLFYDDAANDRHYLLDTTDGGKTWQPTQITRSVSHCELVGVEVWCSAGVDFLKIRTVE